MVKKYLSFNYGFLYGKQLTLFISISVCVGLFIFSILYMMWGIEKKIEVFSISLLYCLLSSIFDFFLIKSKDVLYDESSIYIRKGKKDLVELQYNQISEIKRVFFYFYRISFYESLVNIRNVIYYISPYPSFFMQKELKKILNNAKNTK